MHEAVKTRVRENADFHHRLAEHFFDRAGIDPAKLQQAEDTDKKDSSTKRRASVDKDEQVTEAEKQEPEKSEDHLIADMHLEAAKQLKDLVDNAPPSVPVIKNIRDGLPAYLRRGSVPTAGALPTGVSLVHANPVTR